MMGSLRLLLDPWERAYRRLPVAQRTREPLVPDEAAIGAALASSPVPVTEARLDADAFRAWRRLADYETRHPGYYAGNLEEKSLEHFVAAELADLKDGEVLIDIASQNGTAAEVYERLYGVEAYRQDLDYPAGLHGRLIGGDAARMDVPDAFADVMTLHCSFEHFEGDSDSGFIREAGRVLGPGGRLVILPLYLCQHYAILTGPVQASGVKFEPDARVHAARWYQNRHGRFYDVPHFVSRVWNCKGCLEGGITHFKERGDMGPSIYLQYALVLRKPA